MAGPRVKSVLGGVIGAVVVTTGFLSLVRLIGYTLRTTLDEPDLGHTPEPFILHACFALFGLPIAFIGGAMLGVKISRNYGNTADAE